MKKAMRDWRIWAIFALPVLLCVTVVYLALQPTPGSQQATDLVEHFGMGRNLVTPLPTPTPEPAATPVPAYGPLADPCTVGLKPAKSLQPSMAVVRDSQGRVTDLKFTVRDEGGKPVTCAYLVLVAKVGGASFQSASWVDANGQADYEKIPPGRLSVTATVTRLSLTGSVSAIVQN